MTDNTKNELTAIATRALRQIEAKADLPGNWHTKTIGHLEVGASGDVGTVEVSFFDTRRSLGGYRPERIWVRVMIVVNRFGVVRTVVWTGGNAQRAEKRTVVDGKDVCKTAKVIATARAEA